MFGDIIETDENSFCGKKDFFPVFAGEGHVSERGGGGDQVSVGGEPRQQGSNDKPSPLHELLERRGAWQVERFFKIFQDYARLHSFSETSGKLLLFRV